MARFIFVFGLVSLIGCTGSRHAAHSSPALATKEAPVRITVARADAQPSAPDKTGVKPEVRNGDIRLVAHRVPGDSADSEASQPADAELTYNGRSDQTQHVRESEEHEDTLWDFDQVAHSLPCPEDVQTLNNEPIAVEQTDAIYLNLPSTLAMVDSQHPVVGFAQWRVQEAYAQLARAKVLWLPSIHPGFSFYRHDGNLQASDGAIIDVNRNSFQYGLGAGAVGAGTTPQAGLAATFHLADAIFQPKIVEKSAWATGHAAKAAVNRQLLAAALAYLQLLEAHQDTRIMEDSRKLTAELSRITGHFAEAGQGLQADAYRTQTELSLVDSRLIGARERTAIASARLAQALSIDADSQILPLDATVVPLEMIEFDTDKAALISTGLATRPELKESQALVAEVCEAYRREKFAPLVPSILLGFSAGGFGGGLGDNLADVDDRYDFDARVTWEVRNLGFAERAARRETYSRIQQAKYEKLQVMDQVAREVSEAYSQVGFRREQMVITKEAIQLADDSFRLNLERIRDGQGLPLEALQSLRALEATRLAYLRAVVDYNRAQIQLQWSLGWPVSASGMSHHTNS